MTRGPIDLKVVGDALGTVAECLEGLRSLPAGTLEEFLGDRRNPPAAESYLRRGIQALFDLEDLAEELRRVAARLGGPA